MGRFINIYFEIIDNRIRVKNPSYNISITIGTIKQYFNKVLII